MKKINMTEGNVFKILFRLAAPIMASSFLQFAYNLVDTFWVGGLGSDAVASVGSSSFFISLGYSINALAVIGTGIKVAHSLGADNKEEVKGYISTGMFINLIIALLYSSVLIFGGRYLVSFLNISEAKVAQDAYIYLAVSGPMIIFAFFNVLFSRIYNCYGNNKTTLIINSIGLGINIILDPIMIYVLDLGIFGASAATLIANIVIFIIFLVNSKGIFKFTKTTSKHKVYAKEIMGLGFPMAVQRILFTFINIMLARIVAKYGSSAIAAQKIGLQIESVTFMIIGGLNGAVASFVGQNYGAGKYLRIIKGYSETIKIGIVYAAIMTAGFILIPEKLAGIFVKEADTIKVASSYLRIVGLAQIFSAIEMISNGMFTGIGLPKVPAAISVFFTFLRIPMAMILTVYFGISGVWISIAVSSILKGITSYCMYILLVWRKYKNGQPEY